MFLSQIRLLGAGPTLKKYKKVYVLKVYFPNPSEFLYFFIPLKNNFFRAHATIFCENSSVTIKNSCFVSCDKTLVQKLFFYTSSDLTVSKSNFAMRARAHSAPRRRAGAHGAESSLTTVTSCAHCIARKISETADNLI